MKKHLTTIQWIWLLLIFSCGNDPGPTPQNDYYLKFKVDGVLKEYPISNQPMGFSLDPAGPMYLATGIFLKNPSVGTRDFFSITLRNEEDFRENFEYEMQDTIFYKGAPMVRILLTYGDENGQIFNTVLFQQTLPGTLVTDDASLMFQEIGSTQVKGSFEGVLLGPFSQVTGRGDTELSITEGQFSLPLIDNIP